MRHPAQIVVGGLAAGSADRSFRVSPAGFHLAAILHRDLSAFRAAQIVVDFTRIHWFDGHLTAALDSVFRLAARDGNVVRLKGLRPALRDTFSKNRLISMRRIDRCNTIMPIVPFEMTEGQAFSAYAKRYLDRREMPRMTPSLRSRFFEGIDELFANASLHSRSELPVVAGGQYFPEANRLAFCIADSGEGMERAVGKRLGANLSAADAVAWAMEPYNTTRQGDIPGGLGSKVLRDFIAGNGGRMTVVSNRGYWQQHGSRASTCRLPAPYPGTAVVLEIDTSDQRPCDLAVAPSADSIW